MLWPGFCRALPAAGRGGTFRTESTGGAVIRRSRGRKAALVAGGAVVMMAILEGLFRLWLAHAPTPDNSQYLSDAHCGYRLRPDPELVRRTNPDNAINSFGFRDREHPVDKPPHVRRVLGIGDSFVYGAVRPSENFLSVAERALNRTRAPDSSQAEMILMGIGGYSPENYLGVLESIGLELQPDAVVLCFYVGNDITGIPLRGRVFAGQLYFTGALWRWHDLLRRSWAYLALERIAIYRVKWPLLKAIGKRSARSASTPVQPSTAADTTLSPIYLDFQPRLLPVYERRPSSRVAGLWREAESLVAQFDRACRTAGVPWILLVIPSEVQVDPRVRAGVLRAVHKPASRYDFDLPQRRLRDLAAARGIVLLDPLERLREAHRPEARLYIPNDSHWNEDGNRIVGEMLGEALARLRAP
jgi:hypothetical protein